MHKTSRGGESLLLGKCRRRAGDRMDWGMAKKCLWLFVTVISAVIEYCEDDTTK